MSGGIVAASVHWLAFALIAAALVAACGAALARSLFSMAAFLFVTAALASAALLALNAGGALDLALFGVGLAPALVLALLLLSTRAAKPRRRAPWLTIAAASAAGVAVLAAARDFTSAVPQIATPPGALAPWLAPMLFCAAATCVGLLGFGERGALEKQSRERGE